MLSRKVFSQLHLRSEITYNKAVRNIVVHKVISHNRTVAGVFFYKHHINSSSDHSVIKIHVQQYLCLICYRSQQYADLTYYLCIAEYDIVFRVYMNH